jgi:hypothetical protein
VLEVLALPVSIAENAGSFKCLTSKRRKVPDRLLYEVDLEDYVHVVPVVREGRKGEAA